MTIYCTGIADAKYTIMYAIYELYINWDTRPDRNNRSLESFRDRIQRAELLLL